MDARIKKLWVDDLRSGVPQTQEKLYDGTGYCCLGRLCELHRLDTGNGRWVYGADYEGEWEYVPEDLRASSLSLPVAVVVWAGLDETDPLIADKVYRKHRLSYFNDTLGNTFPEIADIIEKDL